MTVAIRFREIERWALATFPDQTDARVIAHIKEELGELAQACGEARDSAIAEEIADIVILLIALGALHRIDIESAVTAKHEINMSRTWRFDPAFGYDKKVEVA